MALLLLSATGSSVSRFAAAAPLASKRVTPAPIPGTAPKRNHSEYYFCTRLERDRNRNPTPSAAATIRVELTGRSEIKGIYDTEVPAIAQIYHLKLSSARGTDMGERKLVRARGKFELERDAEGERKVHLFTSENIGDGEVRVVHLNAGNTLEDPSFIRVGTSRYHFMLCRPR